MSRRFTRKNKLNNSQRHTQPLMSYKSLFYLYTSGLMGNRRVKDTWVNYGKNWRWYSKLIIKDYESEKCKLKL
ncbi:MAG: hypothetical protein J6Y78_11450 [Paludibacteraceae bacterium]|nr:hypothetical protein [Paludibacteraceae bacterium]